MNNQFRDVAFRLFCEGGHPNDHGLSFKTEVPVRECLSLIQQFMEDRSFEHNHKTAGIAYLLSEWCDAAWEK